MFRREQHRNALALLAAFDSEKLARCQLFFGGGARTALELDEYRVSYSVDFLCSDSEGYAELRFAAAKGGYESLFHQDRITELGFPREMRIDQYGIRFPVVIAGDSIRVELIREARIGLDPAVQPDWSPVGCLSLPDCYAEKLLANADRWADRQVLSRDLIDLCVLRRRSGAIPTAAWSKVEGAYKTAARDDLRKALSAFEQNPPYRQRCFTGLGIDKPEVIFEGLSLLLWDLEEW
jgi:hypothetical protein